MPWPSLLLVFWLWSACSCGRRDAVDSASLAAVDDKPRTPRPGRRLLEIELPHLRGHVNDDAHLLSSEEARALEVKLAAHEERTGQQLALLTLEHLPDASIEDFAYTVANQWKLGRACYDDGVLLIIVSGDRKLRIEVGYGLEPAIPDERAAAVIEEIKPRLASRQYAAATDLAFERLCAAATANPALRSKGCDP